MIIITTLLLGPFLSANSYHVMKKLKNVSDIGLSFYEDQMNSTMIQI